MTSRVTVLTTLGGEAGCHRLASALYARVGKDPVLRRLFPGKSLRCATEAFGAFLIQFLGGDEAETQFRYFLSLRESHARFRISAEERSAWLKHMESALEEVTPDSEMRQALREFFLHSSAYVMGRESGDPAHEELAERWSEQQVLDAAIAAIMAGRDREAMSLAPRFVSRPSVFVGLMARMVKSGREELVRFAVSAAEQDATLGTRRHARRALLHHAAGAGCVELVAVLLRQGADADLRDSGGHTPLYRVANECGRAAGPEIVRMLVSAGADVNAVSGVTRATALHMAAQRGHDRIAQALLECGADVDVRDRKKDTPLRRAMNCRQDSVVRLLSSAAVVPRRPV